MKAEGIIVPLLTPVNEDESINNDALERLINYVIEGGVNAIFVMGSSGEFARFDTDFRFQTIRAAVEIVNGRVPVYAGVSDCGTKRVLRHVENAEKAKADAVVVTLPYYFPIRNDDEAYQHFSLVAANTAIPVVLYNIPGTCGAAISLSVLDRLQEYKNIIGIKDSSGNKDYLGELLSRYHNSDFGVIAGAEELSYEALTQGAVGLVPSLANPFPKLFSKLFRSAKQKDFQMMQKLCEKIDEINRLNQFCNAWMAPNVWRKKALEMMGICPGNMTKPYVPVDKGAINKIQEFIDWYQSEPGLEK